MEGNITTHPSCPSITRCTIDTPSEVKLLATVAFIHGLGEHIGRYDHVFSKFASAGIRVFAYDQRGFGRTVLQNSHLVDGIYFFAVLYILIITHNTDIGSKSNAMVLGDSQGLSVALADIYRACRVEKEVGVRQDGVPHFLFGHSMGGFLALRFAIDYGKEVGLTGVISSGITGCFTLFLFIGDNISPCYSTRVPCSVGQTLLWSTASQGSWIAKYAVRCRSQWNFT
jgi:alpha-beta hydrolase superfamily lysophospholipase